MIFSNILLFPKLTLSISQDALSELDEPEMKYLQHMKRFYLDKGLECKRVDTKLVTKNWIEICEQNKLLKGARFVIYKASKSSQLRLRDRHRGNKIGTASQE